jgi:hypothetical protein
MVEQLGLSEFNTLRSQGLAMNYDAVVAFALERINAARPNGNEAQLPEE